MSKTAFFTMDVERFSDTSCVRTQIERGCISEEILSKEVSVTEDVSQFVSLLKEEKIPGTFFVTADYAKECKDALSKAVSNGGELAVHALHHFTPVAKDTHETASDISKAREIIYETIAKNKINNETNKETNKQNTDIVGYRAPCFGISREIVDELIARGFKYDSSALNFQIAIGSGGLDLTKFNKLADCIYEKDGFYEFTPCKGRFLFWKVPISGGGYLRLFPWPIAKILVRNYIRKHDSYIFYVHPFEIHQSKISKIPGLNVLEQMFVHRGCKIYANKIRKIIQMLRDEGYEFATMQEYILTNSVENDWKQNRI